MSKNQLHHAKIKINPAQLGPIEVKVSVANEQASVSFVANHALVKEAIETALPRLKEAFAENGFSSLNVDVSTSQSSDQEHKSQQVSHHANNSGDSDLDADSSGIGVTKTAQNVHVSEYKVDLFV
jgi:flagellar hook-length control protein FliK